MEYCDDMDPVWMDESPFIDCFVPCPHCGREIACPEHGFEAVTQAMTWALNGCTCAGARAWQEAGCPELLEEGPCASGRLLENGRCGHYAGAMDCTRERCSAWHPELSAPDLHEAGYKRWAKAKSEREAAEAWAPTADLIAYIMTLPAPGPGWTRKTYTAGICRWCGQQHLLPEQAATQEEADSRATAGCSCYAGQAARRRQEERDIISAMFAEFEEDTTEFLHSVASMIRCGAIQSGTTIRVADHISAKFKLKDGMVVVTRAEKLERQHSI